MAALAFLAGLVKYHPKVFGTKWTTEAGMTKGEMKDGNTLLLFAMVVFYAFSSAIILPILVIHQWDAINVFGGNRKLAKPSFANFKADYKIPYVLLNA